MKHEKLECNPLTDRCYEGTCFVCNLFVCKNCNSYEGGLTTDCPNKRVHPSVADAVHAGKIDFINGRWIKK